MVGIHGLAAIIHNAQKTQAVGRDCNIFAGVPQNPEDHLASAGIFVCRFHRSEISEAGRPMLAHIFACPSDKL